MGNPRLDFVAMMSNLVFDEENECIRNLEVERREEERRRQQEEKRRRLEEARIAAELERQQTIAAEAERQLAVTTKSNRRRATEHKEKQMAEEHPQPLLSLWGWYANIRPI